MHLLCLSIPYMCGLHVNPTDYIILYINIFVYIYSIFSDVQPYIHTWTPAQASAYTCVRARIGGAAAHNGRAASKTGRARPPRWSAAGRKAAHTAPKEVTDAVFHAPMSALNADASANACEPSHTQSTPAERTRTFGRGNVRKRGRASWARIGDPILYVAMRMDIDVCIYCVHKYCMYACVCYIDGRLDGVALAHMSSRAVSSARSRDRTCIYG